MTLHALGGVGSLIAWHLYPTPRRLHTQAEAARAEAKEKEAEHRAAQR
jgi:hypothetical protein